MSHYQRIEKYVINPRKADDSGKLTLLLPEQRTLLCTATEDKYVLYAAVFEDAPPTPLDVWLKSIGGELDMTVEDGVRWFGSFPIYGEQDRYHVFIANREFWQ